MIAEHPFFKGMDLRHLKTLSESAMLTEFAENQLIVRAGDIANRFYLILEGKVALESSGEESETIAIQTLEPGDELGWSWMFLPYHWHFDARALGPTKAIFFYGTRIREHCEEDYELGYELMKRITQVLVRRLEATTGHLLSHQLGSWSKSKSSLFALEPNSDNVQQTPSEVHDGPGPLDSTGASFDPTLLAVRGRASLGVSLRSDKRFGADTTGTPPNCGFLLLLVSCAHQNKFGATQNREQKQ